MKPGKSRLCCNESPISRHLCDRHSWFLKGRIYLTYSSLRGYSIICCIAALNEMNATPIIYSGGTPLVSTEHSRFSCNLPHKSLTHDVHRSTCMQFCSTHIWQAPSYRSSNFVRPSYSYLACEVINCSLSLSRVAWGGQLCVIALSGVHRQPWWVATTKVPTRMVQVDTQLVEIETMILNLEPNRPIPTSW